MISDYTITNVAIGDPSPEDAEEAAQMEAAYQEYDSLVMAYQKVIGLEQDPVRRGMLEAFLADLHEENK
jgi:hypothetical protein